MRPSIPLCLGFIPVTAISFANAELCPGSAGEAPTEGHKKIKALDGIHFFSNNLFIELQINSSVRMREKEEQLALVYEHSSLSLTRSLLARKWGA